MKLILQITFALEMILSEVKPSLFWSAEASLLSGRLEVAPKTTRS
jgi:hypothetical protein